MYCKNCGGENYQDAKFCRLCGMSLTTQEVPAEQEPEAYEPEIAEPKKPKSKKKWIVLGIVAVILVAAGLVGRHFYDLRDRYALKGLYGSYYAEDGGMALTYNGSIVEETEDYPSYSVSLNGKTAVYQEEGNLYLLKGEKKEKLDKDTADYGMAYSGRAVAYEKEGKLYHYDCQSKKSEKLTKDLIDFRISFNGKYVAYTTDKGLYIWNGKDSHKIAYGENLDFYIWSVSDDGLVYAVNIEDQENDKGTLYSFTKTGKMTQLEENVWKYGYYVFNRSKDQVIFRIDSTFYISEDGAEPIELDFPDPVGTVYLAGNYNASVKDLREKIYDGYNSGASTYTVFRIDENWNVEMILEDALDVDRSADNSALFARDEDGILYKINVKTGEMKEIAEDVVDLEAAGRGNVYFVDDDGNLYRNSESKKIAEFVERFVGKDNGGVLYLDDDGDLYNAGSVGKGREVDSDVISVSGSREYYTYEKEQDEDESQFDVYYSKNGGKFKKIRGVYVQH